MHFNHCHIVQIQHWFALLDCLKAREECLQGVRVCLFLLALYFFFSKKNSSQLFQDLMICCFCFRTHQLKVDLYPALVTLSIKRLFEPQRKVKQNYQPSSKNWCFGSTKYRWIPISRAALAKYFSVKTYLEVVSKALLYSL